MKLKEVNFLARKRHPPPSFAPQPWASATYSREGEAVLATAPTSEELRKQTALDWNLEYESAVFNNAPLHRSCATSRDDLILAWALLGDFMRVTFFPKAFHNSRDGTRGNLPAELQTRSTSLGKWAGPGFEQTCLTSPPLPSINKWRSNLSPW